MQTQLMNVPFYGDMLVLFNDDKNPMVAMRPIVENMGLDWKSQHEKISERFNLAKRIITTVAEDGKNREMVCLPLRKLPAWLYSISANKVAPHLKEKVIRYQEKCDDVLYECWVNSRSIQGGIQLLAPREPAPELVGAMKPAQLKTKDYVMFMTEMTKYAEKTKQETDQGMRAYYYEVMRRMADSLGIKVAEFEAFGKPHLSISSSENTNRLSLGSN
jgi:hypothetical protein